MGIIKAKDLVHEYIRRDEEGNVESIQTALDKVSLDVKKGDFIAVLGHNGSGKSTLAKHINAILEPTEGSLWVDGFDTTDEKNIWDIRQRAGMVFQNPDNQIIASVVEEDVGFGPENIGVPTDEIWQRVEESLKAVGMLKYREHSPNKLSGGQKQRVAIAGVMAMQPECIVLDEPTAMLDPVGRKEVLEAVHALNREKSGRFFNWFEKIRKGCDHHSDYTLYGRSGRGRPCLCYGCRKSGYAGNAAQHLFPGGAIEGISSGCAADYIISI